MEISYIKDGNRNTMIIKDIEIDENDYKLQMLLRNHIDGIMPMKIEHVNNQSSIHYNISSKTRLPDLYARKQMSGKELYSFIKDVKVLAEKMNEYLLDINSIVFDAELIYFNRQTGKYEFCYIPRLQGDFQISIRDLFDKLLEYINHNDKEAVMIAYSIQQLTIGVDFTLQDLLKCAYENIRELNQKNQENKGKAAEQTREKNVERAKGNMVTKGSEEMFSPSSEKKKGIREILQQLFRKKEKYKTYDEMEGDGYFDEEESMVIAEDMEPYNQGEEFQPFEREERTMILTVSEAVKPIVLTAMGTETPIKIKPITFPYIIGKSSCSCDFCIDSAVVSRVHMRILEELGEFLVEDLNSTNGTFINGEKIEGHKPQPIVEGDKVTIANIDFIVE